MQNDKINNEQHERLCAFLFGELEGAERAAFAQELAASPELQAEQSRIEASMELVKEFAPVAPVSLSPGARAGLVAAAGKASGMPGSAPGPTLAWYRHPGLQVAAATMLAFVAFRALDERMLENAATGEFGRRGEVAESSREATPDAPDVNGFRPVVNVRQTGNTFVQKESAPTYKDPEGNHPIPTGGFNYEARNPAAKSRQGGAQATPGAAAPGPASPAAKGQPGGLSLLGYSDSSEGFKPAADPKRDETMVIPRIQDVVFDSEEEEVDDFKAVTGSVFAEALVSELPEESHGGTFKGPSDVVPPVGGGGAGLVNAPVAPDAIYVARFKAGVPLAVTELGAAPSESPAPVQVKPVQPVQALGGIAASTPGKGAPLTEGPNAGGVPNLGEGFVAGLLDGEEFQLPSLLPQDSKKAAEITANLERSVSEARTKLAQFEADSKERKNDMLNGNVVAIGDNMTLLNETLASVEQAKDDAVEAVENVRRVAMGGSNQRPPMGGQITEGEPFAKGTDEVFFKAFGAVGTPQDSETGSGGWFLGTGEEARVGGGGGGGGDAVADNEFPHHAWLVQQEAEVDGGDVGLPGLNNRRGGGAGGGVLGPDGQATSDRLGVTFGMTAAGERVEVDMPVAQARLAELEQLKVVDEREPIGFSGGRVEPMSDEDKAELDLLRGYFEFVEVTKQQAEQDRLLAEQAQLEAKLRRAIEVEREYLTIVQNCIPKVGEKPSAMYYRYWGDNGYEFPVNDNLSTFSIDVDTASYTLARRYLKDGYLPERAQIRTEEFVNYATPDLPAPTGGDVFGITMELAPSPFGPNAEAGGEHRLLRIGVRGMEVDMTERDPVALTFVVDVSGSMATGGRLELVKHSLRLLVGELSPTDSIALITFNNTATRVLDMTSVGNGSAIERALYEMKTGGGTNAESGLRLGYEEAVLAHTPGAQNRVVFLSDGVGNIGETDEQKLIADVKRARDKGIYLNTIGFGMTNHNDRFLEQLADGGDGLCNYVDSPDEAQRALVDNFTGAFQTIARDVKIQVEFDKNQVLSYRQLGYENRAIADVNFRNDAVDAGEVGAGQQVVALYEVVLRNADPSNETPLATTRVRYKAPYGKLLAKASGGSGQPGASADGDKQLGANEATEIESSFYWNQSSGLFDGASIGFQKSALSAQFAEFLRRSSHAKNDSLSLLRYKLEELAKTTGDPEVIELSALVQLAQPQLEPALLAQNSLRRAADELQRFEYDCLRTSYVDGDQSEDWLVSTNATREHLRESLRIEVYESWGIENR